MTLPGANTQSQSGLGRNGNEKKQTPHSLEFQGWTLTVRSFNTISRTLIGCGGGLTLLQRCRWCILQRQPTRVIMTMNR